MNCNRRGEVYAQNKKAQPSRDDSGRLGLSCVTLESFSYDCGLPMASAAVSAAAAVEAATAAHCATATDCAAVESTADRYMRAAAVEAVANCAASDVATVPAITTVPAVASVPPNTTMPAVAAITGASIEAPAVPRTGTDEDATGEVARAVVTVRRASVWVIPIVAVCTDRSWPDVARPHAHSNRDVLSTSVRRQSQRGSKYCKDH